MICVFDEKLCLIRAWGACSVHWLDYVCGSLSPKIKAKYEEEEEEEDEVIMNTYYIGVIIKWIYYTSTKYIYLYQLREATKLNCWHAKRARKGRCPNDDQSIIPPWTCWPASPKNSHDRWRRLTARSAHTCNRDRLRHSSSTSIFCIFFFLALSFNTGEREETIKFVYVCRCCIDSRASGTRISTAQVIFVGEEKNSHSIAISALHILLLSFTLNANMVFPVNTLWSRPTQTKYTRN